MCTYGFHQTIAFFLVYSRRILRVSPECMQVGRTRGFLAYKAGKITKKQLIMSPELHPHYASESSNLRQLQGSFHEKYRDTFLFMPT